MNKKIALGTILAVILTFAVFFTTFAYWGETPIMEHYYGSDDYEYVINTITDVVYVKINMVNFIGLNRIVSYSLVPLYKPDGTLITGEELKQSIEDNDSIVIY